MKLLKPQTLKPSYFEPIEKQLLKMFFDIILKPTIDILKKNTSQKVKLNARINILEEALKDGVVQYDNGIFSGKFNYRLSKQLRDMGAKFDSKMKVFKINPSKVPADIKQRAALAYSKAKDMHQEIAKTLENTQNNLDQAIEAFKIHSDDMIIRMSEGWKSASAALSIKPELTKGELNKMSTNYNKNIKTYAKDFAVERFKAIRDTVQENAKSGYRFDSLIKDINKEYTVSESKAKFIARQETGLFMASFRKERFRQAGVTHYIWSARPMARPDHKDLNGKTFAYDNPPITNKATGARNNPGEDFGCLCVDRPILGGA